MRARGGSLLFFNAAARGLIFIWFGIWNIAAARAGFDFVFVLRAKIQTIWHSVPIVVHVRFTAATDSRVGLAGVFWASVWCVVSPDFKHVLICGHGAAADEQQRGVSAGWQRIEV